MDTSNILKPTAVQKQSFSAKALRFLSAFLLAEIILNSAAFDFIEKLNEKGILGMGAGFKGMQLFWGDGFSMNLLRLIIVVFFSGLFGFLYGYLSKKISASEKVIINSINMVMAVFGTAIFALIAIAFIRPEYAGEMNKSIALMIHTVFSAPFYISFILLNLAGSFAFGYYCTGIGIRTINNPYHYWDKEKSGTLLDIKWYHYLWLWMPLGFYSKVAINLVYATGHTVISFFRNVRWFEFLGVSVASDGIEERSSFDMAWGNLFAIYIAAVIIYYLLSYLREVLANEKKMHWALKILVSLGIGVVLPFVLIMFTVLGG